MSQSLNSLKGVLEQKMETTIVYWGLYRDNGKENGNCYLGFRVLGYMSCSLNSLKGDYIRDHIGDYYRGY